MRIANVKFPVIFAAAIVLLFALSSEAFAESVGSPALTESGGSAVSAESGETADAAGKAAQPDTEHMPENGIPLITLTVDPDDFQKVLDSPRHEYQAENCSVRIDVPGGWEGEYGPLDEETIGRELPLKYFRGRGNSTWNEDKKPFKFRLQESTDLLAMGTNEHWVLLANAKDNSLLRTRIVSWIGEAVGLIIRRNSFRWTWS